MWRLWDGHSLWYLCAGIYSLRSGENRADSWRATEGQKMTFQVG